MEDHIWLFGDHGVALFTVSDVNDLGGDLEVEAIECL